MATTITGNRRLANPNRSTNDDTRTPAQLLDFIEAKGRDADEAIARLRCLIVE
ncbi:MAG TPA: hypothetical protein P5534_03965 [Candidatus Paceibacterota bacterium]|nr:hypothetical protein [Candidatus Paceibacterota bacterium]HRZ54348.1 hypothetical protein [Candidatus Paceibacterota bacterium]